MKTYDIVVEKEGFSVCFEDGFSISGEQEEIEKNFSLARQGSKPPVADAGDDRTIRVGNYVIMDGGNSDPGDGDTLTYLWVVGKDNPESFYLLYDYDKPYIIIPFRKEGVYTFYLVVHNGIMDSEPDEFTITVEPREEILFDDPNLEIAVRYQLGKPDEELTESDLLELTYLTGYPGCDISSLEGIEKCKNLERLNLTLQDIKDISPISGLIELKWLDLDQNRIIQDISPLAGLVNLENLNLDSNEITDVSSLANLG